MSFCELYTFIAYLFVRTKNKDEHIEKEIATPVSTFNHSYKKPPPWPPITEPLMLQEQIPKSAMQTFQVDVGREKEDQTERS